MAAPTIAIGRLYDKFEFEQQAQKRGGIAAAPFVGKFKLNYSAFFIQTSLPFR